MRIGGTKHLMEKAGAVGAGLYCLAAFGVQAVFAAEHGAEVGEVDPAAAVDSAAAHGHADTAHGTVAAHGDAHADAGLPQFDPSTYPSQIFWLVVCFVILYVYFSSRVLPDLSGILENRRNQITGDLETAERLKNEAEAAQHAYETGLEKARLEAMQTVAAVQEKMRNAEVEAVKTFAGKSDSDIKALELRLTKAKEGVMDEMNTIAAEVARAAAEKIVGISTDLKQAKTVVQAISKKEAA